ncbi:EAL domain-containing protein [Paenibacillus thalictri]|uniref:EAL domain-containing protein n=2 Tax=Paenibacillus thalictri TaxID=2527873 RepID=A0A4Q9DE85_9BACL|nr:EAL domain-containing protein [Paenibacillus thalictri]
MLQHVNESYQVSLVLLSYLISVFASFTSLDLVGRVTSASGKIRKLWLWGGSVAMGLGIWSMHFIAMLALRTPLHTHYHIGTVLISMIFAIAASFVAMYVVSRKKVLPRQLFAGALFMGSGIAGMHYAGIYAMEMSAVIVYNPAIVMLSLGIAYVSSFSALWLAFSFRRERSEKRLFRKICSGMAMGAGISGMHFTGMSAMKFVPDPDDIVYTADLISADLLAYSVGIATFAVLAFTMLGAFMDRQFAQHAAQLAASQQQYKSLFENNSDAVFQMDRNGRFVSVNPAIVQITGYSAECLIDKHVSELLHLKERNEVMARFGRTLSGEAQKFGVSLKHREGRTVELNVTSMPILSEDQVIGIYGIAHDVTEQIQAERKITYLAYHDEMTGLPNRRRFIDMLSTELGRSGETPLAVLIMDVDRFKVVNDSIGQKQGDILIRKLAERVLQALPKGAELARYGSDEFTVILRGVNGAEETERWAQKLLDAVRTPFMIDSREIYLTVTIGISLYPLNGGDYETLLSQADTALLHAKKYGTNQIQQYASEMDFRWEQRLELENGIRKALERDEFELCYQPQYDITGTLVGAEALVRWHHPEMGMISPALFIPAAEESGLIKPLGEWVLREACRQNKLWQMSGLASIRISVNLSIKQFEQPDLADKVAAILRETGLAPQYLELEITETMAMDVDRATRTLHDLKSLGLYVSMDDFGTGYSSLSVLKQFPIDKLKIDQSFVRDLHKDEGSASIVATIVAMAHHLNLKVIAEGVETKEQYDFLREHQCDQIQGFYFSPPLSPAEFARIGKAVV